MDDAERLEAIEEALDRLRMLSSDHVILVEGSKDVSALEAVGVTGDLFCVQSGGGPVRAAEYAWRRQREARPVRPVPPVLQGCGVPGFRRVVAVVARTNYLNGEGLRRRDGRIHRHRGHRRFGEDHGLQVRRGVPPQGGLRRGGHRGAHP